jgi:hypothetical protein
MEKRDASENICADLLKIPYIIQIEPNFRLGLETSE